MPAPQDLGRRTRRLCHLVEPLAAIVFFVPEAHDAYVRLGFPPPRGAEDRVSLFDWGAYFVSRAAYMGQGRGEVACLRAYTGHGVVATRPSGSQYVGQASVCRVASTGLARDSTGRFVARVRSVSRTSRRRVYHRMDVVRPERL